MVDRDQARRLARGLADELAFTASGDLRERLALLASPEVFARHAGLDALRLDIRTVREWEQVVWRALEVAELADDLAERNREDVELRALECVEQGGHVFEVGKYECVRCGIPAPQVERAREWGQPDE